jgi:hypothetical protein
MEDERNKNGQFKPGHKGGPGRGNRKDKYPWAVDPVAYRKQMDPKVLRVIAGMIDNSDQKIQREGAKLYIQLFGMDTEARGELTDPKLLGAFGEWFFGGLEDTTGAEVVVDTSDQLTNVDGMRRE